jgi:hypothetical protein
VWNGQGFRGRNAFQNVEALAARLERDVPFLEICI